MKTSVIFIFMINVCILGAQQQVADPEATEQWDPVPEIVTPGQGTAPPSDAIILQGNDTNLSMWESTTERLLLTIFLPSRGPTLPSCLPCKRW